MTPSGAFETYRRACAVSDLRWREWCKILHSNDTGEALRIASKQYRAAEHAAKWAGKEWRTIAAREIARTYRRHTEA